MSSFRAARRCAFRIGVGVLALALSGCGYHLQGAGGSSLPPHIKKSHVPIIVNQTLEQGIEVQVTDAIRRVIIDDGRVSLATGIADADAVLEGEVLQYRLRAIAFTRGDRAQEFRLRMTLAVSLRDQENGKILFRQTIVSDREYEASTNLSSNEKAQTDAAQKASTAIARELQGLLIEGF
ncbi:MAG: LPS assembly lipoprotein LptE [Nitrospinota bacterium]